MTAYCSSATTTAVSSLEITLGVEGTAVLLVTINCCRCTGVAGAEGVGAGGSGVAAAI